MLKKWKWKKKHPDLLLKFEERLAMFCSEPFSNTLKTHSLSSNLKEYHALSIDIGSHDEVY